MEMANLYYILFDLLFNRMFINVQTYSCNPFTYLYWGIEAKIMSNVNTFIARYLISLIKPL